MSKEIRKIRNRTQEPKIIINKNLRAVIYFAADNKVSRLFMFVSYSDPRFAFAEFMDTYNGNNYWIRSSSVPEIREDYTLFLRGTDDERNDKPCSFRFANRREMERTISNALHALSAWAQTSVYFQRDLSEFIDKLPKKLKSPPNSIGGYRDLKWKRYIFTKEGLIK